MRKRTKDNLIEFGLFVLIMALFVASSVVMMGTANATGNNEAYYAKQDCDFRGGVLEYRNSDGTRTDCYLPLISIEYDFAYKWYECITQSMHYARLNDNGAVCALIIQNDLGIKHYNRAVDFVKFYNLRVNMLGIWDRVE